MADMNRVDLSSQTREALEALSRRTTDRDAPPVFAGRDAELRLLEDSARGTAAGGVGHTTVVQGVPGAGKTALMNEFAARLAVEDDLGVIGIPMDLSCLDASPAKLVHEIDQAVKRFQSSDSWKHRANTIVGGTSVAGRLAIASITKRDFNDFQPARNDPLTLATALEGYGSFRFDRRGTTIVLLFDEAQGLRDTPAVRDRLRELHGGTPGPTKLIAAFFGLANAQDRLRELGLSRLAGGHAVELRELDGEDAAHVVRGTLEIVFAQQMFHDGGFDGERRREWIDLVTGAILAVSANFPHHLQNGCRAVAEAILEDGAIGHSPPVRQIIERCEAHKLEYYDARLKPWRNHTAALAFAFSRGQDSTTYKELKSAIMASDNRGEPVPDSRARDLIEDIAGQGYILEHMGRFRPALPSLASHFAAIQAKVIGSEDVQQALSANGQWPTDPTLRVPP